MKQDHGPNQPIQSYQPTEHGCRGVQCCWAALAGALLLVGATRAAALQPVPEKLVVLTFDDSVRSHYTVVRPILLKYGFGATFFITEGFDFSTNKQDTMTWEQITNCIRTDLKLATTRAITWR